MQVTFTASELVTGVARIDEEVELHLRARMHSSVKRKARPVGAAEQQHGGKGPQQHQQEPNHRHPNAHHHHHHRHHHHDAQQHHKQQHSLKQPGKPSTDSQAHEQQQLCGEQQDAAAGGTVARGTAASTAVVAPPGAAEAHDEAPAQAAGPQLQQVSRLRCDVEVRLRVRVPPPLSAVPGPLLSTTGGLLAKLVMQALLPSFLDLLGVDYKRWASGDASRRTVAAGSLVPAAAKGNDQDRNTGARSSSNAVLPFAAAAAADPEVALGRKSHM
jgi:hypothetical protein